MLSAIRNYFVSVQDDPDEARKRELVRILSMGLLVLSLIAFTAIVLFIIFDPTQWREETQLALASAAIAFVVSAGIYRLNNKSSRLASFFLLLLLVIVPIFSDTTVQVVNGRSLFLFTLPIAIASLILLPIASFLFAFLSTMIVVWLSLSIDIFPNMPAIIGFFMLALVSWLSARSLEQVLKELRSINTNLDKVVTERTQALAESLDREKVEAGRNQAILNSIADGVIVFDRKWNATMANPAIKSMLEVPMELLNGKNFRELIEHPKLQPKSRGLLYAMMEHETQPVGFRIEWGGKTLSVSAAQVYNNRSENIGTVTVFRDFTREAEVERLKSTFVAIVSHELRTPLNAILGYAEMFKESIYGPMNEKQVNMSERIMKNTQRLLGLINDLLDQAQMEAGKLTIKMGPVRPAELLESLHSVMDKTASDKGLVLTSEIEDRLPDTLNGDAARLQQILVNLVNNAVKFTDKGSVNVKLLHLSETRWGIQVSDTGRGIPNAEIPHIFETFRQVEGATTRIHGGFGLGLSIVKQLVNLMNGEVEVQSTMNIGTTFTIILPLVVTEKDQFPT